MQPGSFLYTYSGTFFTPVRLTFIILYHVPPLVYFSVNFSSGRVCRVFGVQSASLDGPTNFSSIFSSTFENHLLCSSTSNVVFSDTNIGALLVQFPRATQRAPLFILSQEGHLEE